jgi:hypothetical protein
MKNSMRLPSPDDDLQTRDHKGQNVPARFCSRPHHGTRVCFSVILMIENHEERGEEIEWMRMVCLLSDDEFGIAPSNESFPRRKKPPKEERTAPKPAKSPPKCPPFHSHQNGAKGNGCVFVGAF